MSEMLSGGIVQAFSKGRIYEFVRGAYRYSRYFDVFLCNENRRTSPVLVGVEDVSLRSQGFIAKHLLHQQIDIPFLLM